jgi:single-strand DNA-binding protein
MYQRTEVIGHLGRDPEMRYTPSGQAVTTFSVATTRRWTGQDGQPQEKTTWFRVTAWGKLGELCNQYLSKGRLVLVEGEIDASAWTGQDGQPRATLELRARDVRFLGGPGQAGEGEANTMRDRPGLEEEEIPF